MLKTFKTMLKILNMSVSVKVIQVFKRNEIAVKLLFWSTTLFFAVFSMEIMFLGRKY